MTTPTIYTRADKRASVIDAVRQYVNRYNLHTSLLYGGDEPTVSCGVSTNDTGTLVEIKDAQQWTFAKVSIVHGEPLDSIAVVPVTNEKVVVDFVAGLEAELRKLAPGNEQDVEHREDTMRDAEMLVAAHDKYPKLSQDRLAEQLNVDGVLMSNGRQITARDIRRAFERLGRKWSKR